MKYLSSIAAALILLAPALAHADAVTAGESGLDEAVVVIDGDAGGELQLVNRNEELGFFEKHFPFSTDVQHPETDDAMVGIWLAAAFLPFGWLWGPYAFADEKPGGDFAIDAVITVLVHMIPVLFLLIPIVNIFLFPFILLYNFVNGFYLLPVAIINAYDRSLDEVKAGGGGGRRRRGRDRDRDDRYEDDYDDEYEEDADDDRPRRRRRSSALELPSFAANQASGASLAY